MTSHDHRRHVDHCLNCGAPTPGAFCSSCGQEAVDAAVTFRDQMAHFFEEVFGVESRLPQTVRLLLTRPGELTRAYNSGQRVRFVTPLKLYLFASVAFFLTISLSTAAGRTQIVRLDHGDSAINVNVRPPPGKDDHAWRSAEDFDEWLKVPGHEKEIPAFFQPHLRTFLKSPEGFASALLDMLSKASMALVPIHALLLKVLYWRPRRLYGEHIVFSLHLHSFGYVLYSLSLLPGLFARGGLASALSTIAVVGGGVYAIAAARTAYAEGLGRSTLKMTLAGIGYAFALFGVVTVVAAATFLLN